MTIEPRGIRDEQRMAAREIRMLSTTKRTRSMAVVAVLLGALLLTAPAMAAQSLAVTGQSTSGSVLTVTVRNFSSLAMTKTIAAQVIVGDTAVWSYVPVVVFGGQTATVSLGFGGTVKSVVSVGVQDCPVPF